MLAVLLGRDDQCGIVLWDTMRYVAISQKSYKLLCRMVVGYDG